MDEMARLDSLKNAWQAALAGEYGDTIIRDLKYYASRQVHTPGDPYTTAFNDGQRVMAANILQMVEED